jgi:hypothetical protein
VDGLAKKKNNQEDFGQGYSSDLGEADIISSSMGDITYEYDKTTDSYEVNINFNRGGSANYSLDADTVLELDANGGTFYNQSIRGQM